MRRITQIGLLAALGALATAAMAVAATGWVANPGTTFADGVVTLDSTGQPAGTSYENPALDVQVENGDTISFEYRSADVACAGGVPRVFIQAGAFNTFDGDPAGEEACGTDGDGDGWFLVSQEISGIVAGPAGQTGIVNDNPADPGTIEVRNLIIAGEAVLPEQSANDAKKACKKGGWKAQGFRNQGQCVSHFAKQANQARKAAKAKNAK
jgi:hypothetical protein